MSQEKLEAVTLDAHHHIGKSQNEPEHIGTFLSKNAGDPAIKVKFGFLFLQNNVLKGVLGLPASPQRSSPSQN